MAKTRNGTVVKWIGAIGTLILISSMAVVGWIWNASKFQTNISTRVEVNEKADELWHPQIQIHNIAVAEIRKDISRLESMTEETKTMQKEILNKQEEILWELRGP